VKEEKAAAFLRAVGDVTGNPACTDVAASLTAPGG